MEIARPWDLGKKCEGCESLLKMISLLHFVNLQKHLLQIPLSESALFKKNLKTSLSGFEPDHG